MPEMHTMSEREAFAANFRELHPKFSRMYVRILDRVDLTFPQYTLLYQLMLLGAVSMTEISDRLEITKPAVTNLVDRLEEKKFLRRVPNAEDRRRLMLHTDEIKSLARVETLVIADHVDKMANAAGKVLERMEIIVPLVGLVDFAEEAGRIRKAIDKAETERDRLLKKLANESFVARAPAAVVEKDRARAAELEAMLGKLKASLTELPQT